MKRHLLRIQLAMWKRSRQAALRRLREDFPGEYDNAQMTHSIMFPERKGSAVPVLPNAQYRLSEDYALHDAADDLL